MARYQIFHRTRYSYAYPVSVSHHSACLKPRDHRRQNCHQYEVAVDPRPPGMSDRRDFFGNTLHLFAIEETHAELVVDAHSEVSVAPAEIPMPALTPSCDEVRQFLADDLSRPTLHALQHTSPSPLVEITPAVEAYTEPHDDGSASYLQCAAGIAARIHDEFTFDPTATDVTTPLDEFLEQKRGVCQDYAHLMIAVLRALRLPARYVSGYILTHPPEGEPRLEGADASHAWVAVFLPNIGWVDIDPTNRQYCSEEHVTVAVGRDYSDVSLLRGAVTGGGSHSIDIEVTMTPLTPGTTRRLLL